MLKYFASVNSKYFLAAICIKIVQNVVCLVSVAIKSVRAWERSPDGPPTRQLTTRLKAIRPQISAPTLAVREQEYIRVELLAESPCISHELPSSVQL